MFNHMDLTDHTTPLAPLLQITLGCDRCIVSVPFKGDTPLPFLAHSFFFFSSMKHFFLHLAWPTVRTFTLTPFPRYEFYTIIITQLTCIKMTDAVLHSYYFSSIS